MDGKCLMSKYRDTLTGYKPAPRFCIDCKHHVTIRLDNSFIPDIHKCDHLRSRVTNPVTGTQTSLLCEEARRSGFCGVEAVLWEAK